MTLDNDPAAIEQDFIASWDSMEKFFTYHSALTGYEWLKAIFALMAEFRQRGYDRQFRAGQSMDSFILSRSREHGLRDKHAALQMGIIPEGGMWVRYYEYPDTDIQREFERVEVNDQLEQLLARLREHPIN